MTAKEYLSQARLLDNRINTKIQQIASLNELATKCTSTLSDMPRSASGNSSKMEDAILKIITLQDEINSDIDALVDLKQDIMSAIKSVGSVELQIILEKRYLCFESWEQIAVDLSFSIQHTYRMHDIALKEITNFLKMRVNERE